MWSILICAIVMQTAVITPLRIAFIEEASDDYYWRITDALADVIFCVDIVINFITTEEKENG